MANKIYIGDYGTQIILDTETDLVADGFTVLKIKYQKPDGTRGEWVGSITDVPDLAAGNNRGILYQVQTGELDQVEAWQFQSYGESPGWTGHGDVVSMHVHDLFT